MTETEREALSKILVALFLESPKRKALLGNDNTEKSQNKTSTTKQIRTYQLGDTQHVE
jgi:hypothetical protein